MELRVAFVGNTGVIANPSGRPSQSTQVRVLNVAQKLREEFGMASQVVYPSHDPQGIVTSAISDADVVVFHRIQGSKRTWVDSGYVKAYVFAKRLGKRVVFDVDDAIHLYFPGVSELIALTSSSVMAGSHALVETYRPFSANVALVPSAVDTDVIQHVRSSEKNTTVLGWHGSARGHLQNLLSLSGVLSRLSHKYDLTFRVLGTEGDARLQQTLQKRYGGVRLEFGPRYWFPYHELTQNLADVDIGLYPLLDSVWNRAKCSMKLLEYMAMELPSCSSDVGENRFIVKDGEDGFLASGESDWVAKVGRLIDDGALRKTMGGRARSRVLQSYSVRSVSRTIEKVLRA